MSEGPLTLAPELAVKAWYNTKGPVDLLQLRGKVVVIYAVSTDDGNSSGSAATVTA